jgi:hypothetical protein
MTALLVPGGQGDRRTVPQSNTPREEEAEEELIVSIKTVAMRMMRMMEEANKH